MRQVNLRLDDELLARVDAAAGDVPRNRWLVRTIEAALDPPMRELSPAEAAKMRADFMRPHGAVPSSAAKRGITPRTKGKP